MRGRRALFPFAGALLVLAWLSTASGCISYSDLKVKLVDAESGRPINGGTVKVNYIYYLSLLPRAEPANANTNGQGLAVIPIARNPGGAGTQVRVNAKTYHDAVSYLRYQMGEWRTGQNAKLIDASRQNPAIQFELFKKPNLTVWLEFERGYRGVVRVMVNEIANKPFPRKISKQVDASGQVRVQVPEGLRGLNMDVAARYTDGTKIRSKMYGSSQYDDSVVLRDLATDGDAYYFVLGTQDDHARAHQQVYLGPNNHFSAEALKALELGNHSR
jgi:hypothetical protein